MKNEEFIKELEKKIGEYHKVCEKNLQEGNSVNTYIGYSNYFLRWVKGDFIPGEKRKKK